jgi:hypothetical protein
MPYACPKSITGNQEEEQEQHDKNSAPDDSPGLVQNFSRKGTGDAYQLFSLRFGCSGKAIRCPSDRNNRLEKTPNSIFNLTDALRCIRKPFLGRPTQLDGRKHKEGDDCQNDERGTQTPDNVKPLQHPHHRLKHEGKEEGEGDRREDDPGVLERENHKENENPQGPSWLECAIPPVCRLNYRNRFERFRW